MTEALMLIQTYVGSMEDVYEEIKNMEGVQRVAMIMGPYDVMVLIKAENISKITEEFIGKIRNIEGVKETTTNIFIE